MDEAIGLDLDDFTYDDYRWAVATVMSRQNNVPLRTRYFACRCQDALCIPPFLSQPQEPWFFSPIFCFAEVKAKNQCPVWPWCPFGT